MHTSENEKRKHREMMHQVRSYTAETGAELTQDYKI